MIPTDSYRIAEKHDYRTLQRLAPDEDGYTFPTIIARRDSRVIGFAASNPDKRFLRLGRMWIDPSLRVPGIIAIRLLDAYDMVARQLKQHWYVIVLDKGSGLVRHARENPGFEIYGESDQFFFIKRTVPQKEVA